MFSTNIRRILLILVAVISVVLCVHMLLKAHRPQGYDFSSYLLSADALLQGKNPYQTESIFPYLYPLFLCFFLIPFLTLPYWLSSFLWFFINLLSLIYAARILIITARQNLEI